MDIPGDRAALPSRHAVPPWVGARQIRAALAPGAAADAIERALRGGLDPAAGIARTVVDVASGTFLLMPAAGPRWVGAKLVTVAGANAERGIPVVQAAYVLFDATTLTPVALLDGTALTNVRTPAVSAVALRHLGAPDASTLVVFGSGAQARGHVEAFAMERPLERVVVVGRDADRAEALAGHARGLGLDARVGTAAAVSEAHVVVCATTSATPLFDGSAVRPGAVVVAVGSYQPHTREVGSDLVARAVVVVEDVAAARREDGVVMLAEGDGVLEPERLVGLADLVHGRVVADPGRPALFTSVGMAWEDLVVAGAVWEAQHPS